MTLNEWLKKSGTTKAEFARALKVDASTVTRWCSGSEPSLAMVEAIETGTNGAVRTRDWLKKGGGK